MRPLLMLACLCVVTETLAQEDHFALHYAYIWSPRLDRSIQTYNATRPFLGNAQPLLQHGIGCEYGHLFPGARTFRSGIGVTYGFFTSKATNEGFKNTFNLNLLAVDYTLRYTHGDQWRRLALEGSVGLLGTGLFRRVNEAPLDEDGLRIKAYGFGAQVGIRSTFLLHQGVRARWSAYGGVRFCPYLWNPNAEVVLNQTKGLVGEPWTTATQGELGIRYSFGPEARGRQSDQ
jgi:hypothetical protein